MMCDNKKIHNEVLSMRPIGYWPCDEGEGNVLRDLSESGNDGSLYNVLWENGLLNFSGLFQWGVIPNHKSYQKDAFSIGGWIFIRNPAIGG